MQWAGGSDADHRLLERTGMAGGMGYGLVHVVQAEGGERVVIRTDQAGVNQFDQAWNRRGRQNIQNAIDGSGHRAAAALCLSQAEHVHLRALTHGPKNKLFAQEVVPPTILRVVQAVVQPAYIAGRRWDVLAWNAAAEAIFDFSKVPEADRNILVFMLTLASSRRLFGPGWAAAAQRMVAEFRATHDLWAGEPAFLRLLQRLRQACPEFTGWWDAHDVRSAVAGHKSLYHPTKGLLGFDYAAFHVNDNPALKLVIYLPQQEP